MYGCTGECIGWWMRRWKDGWRAGGYLIFIFLGDKATLSQHEVKGSAGHENAMTQIPKHDSKQEGECDDGVGS